MTEQELLDAMVAVSEMHFWYGWLGGICGWGVCQLTDFGWRAWMRET